ncbi:uncharacterized protein BDR25DRAFT_355682 [Lindgomyces ingoldianus]|uniref:Uncharacterized protein n=1 Tax=Lindgomyces ingoldianus TaxID=673940 RepID=A0ACB6QV59_9PLEO|nr:uncharacterized protein BDR25DRAFT_355682 [Lindgomyces ingoldianus]KAF2469955.1 hypothetical protein BDR25DRAFT_355682 [Lindgomyces ingoldianus]
MGELRDNASNTRSISTARTWSLLTDNGTFPLSYFCLSSDIITPPIVHLLQSSGNTRVRLSFAILNHPLTRNKNRRKMLAINRVFLALDHVLVILNDWALFAVLVSQVYAFSQPVDQPSTRFSCFFVSYLYFTDRPSLQPENSSYLDDGYIGYRDIYLASLLFDLRARQLTVLSYRVDDKRIHGKCGSLNLTYLIKVLIITKLLVATKKKMGAIVISGIGLGICLSPHW